MIIDVHINYPLIVSSPQPPPPPTSHPPWLRHRCPAPDQHPAAAHHAVGVAVVCLGRHVAVAADAVDPGSRGAEAERPGFEVPFLVGFEGWYL